MKLTERVLETLVFEGATPQSQDVRWDDALPNFGVRVLPSGEKSFVIRYRAGGRRRFLTLGRHGVLALEQARTMARIKLAEALQGGDPLAEKRQTSRGRTIADLADYYLKHYAKPRKRSWKDDEARLRDYVLPRWGKRRVDEIRHRDVVRLHAEIGKDQPINANRIVALLSKMFAYATRTDFLEEGAPNPCKGVERFPEVKRERFLHQDELPFVTAAIDEQPMPYRQLYWLYLLTGLRRDELRCLTWQEVNFARAELTIAGDRTKSGRPLTLPLPPKAVELLREIPRIDGNPHVFFGVVEKQPIGNVNAAWQVVRTRATAMMREVNPDAKGVEDVWIHDLRRTLGSMMVQSGASLALIGRVLNHSNQSTTAIYARFHQDPVREALSQHGQRLIASSKPQPVLEAELVASDQPASEPAPSTEPRSP